MIETLLREYGYWIVFLGSLIEGESVILAASAAAYHGYLSLPKIMVIAFLGTLCADQFFYQIGRRYGHAILERFPKLKGPSQRAFDLLRRYDTLFILSFRFIYGIRNVSPIVVGMSGVSVLRFTVLNIIAAALWSVLSCLIGYFGSELFEIFWPFVKEHRWAAIIGFIGFTSFVFFIIIYCKFKKNKKY